MNWLSDGVAVLGVIAAAALFLFFLVRWHARSFGYECPQCASRFAVGAWIDFISPHYPDKKRLTCPHCRERSWCREIPISEVTGAAESGLHDQR